MFEASVADAKEAIAEMAAVLADVGMEFKALGERLEVSQNTLNELESNPRGQYSKKLRLARQLRSDMQEFSEGIEEVSLGLNGSHDRLVQTLGDVLLVCDIDNPSQMSEFYSLMKSIVESLKLVAGLIKMSEALPEHLSESPFVSQATLRTVDKLTNELNRVSSVFTRMIHLSEYFT